MKEKTVKVSEKIYNFLLDEKQRLLDEEGLDLPIKAVMSHVFHSRIFKAQKDTKKHEKTQSSTIKHNQATKAKQTKQEQAYLLREKEKLTYKQISEQMECTESQVRSFVTKEKAKRKQKEAAC